MKEFYSKYFGIPQPFKHQEEIWNLLRACKTPLLLRAPTGSGKTEAVLAPFLMQFVENKFNIAPRMIYVLPMRVLVNSIHKRIEEYAKKVSPHISVKIQHGDVPNSPFFIGDIIVTTLDQFLYGFARASKEVGHHIDIPAGSIVSSIVIFDETHMYRDEFTFSIMRALMEILYKSNIPFVLMTATMPESLEKSLFENIKLCETQKIFGDPPIISNLKITLSEKPLYKDNRVDIPDEILDKIKIKKTLIVLNQVKRAQKVYEEIKSRLCLNENQIVLLHSRFTRMDRENHEKKAISLIPHKEKGRKIIPEGVGVVISTQVLEAGIDFSAELLLTELAPADSLIQRAGRCARYEGDKGEMIIFPVEDKDKKGYKPYEEKHLKNALKWLQSKKNFNMRNFKNVCSFVNETLDYQANDYEARDTLIDLYECVLYADTKPENIQIRKNKSAKVIVVEPKIGEKKSESKLDQIMNGIKENFKKLNDLSFDVDIKILWGWLKDGLIFYELRWEENQLKLGEIKAKVKQDEENQGIAPFKTYIIESSNYSKEEGVKNDNSIFI